MPNPTSRILRAFVRALVYTVLTGATLFAVGSIGAVTVPAQWGRTYLILCAVGLFAFLLVWELARVIVHEFHKAAQIIDRGVRGER